MTHSFGPLLYISTSNYDWAIRLKHDGFENHSRRWRKFNPRYLNLKLMTNFYNQPGGNVGRQVIKALLEEGSFSITAIIRPTSTYTSPPSSLHFTTLTADFDSLSSIAKALENQDALVCCVPGGATHFAPQRLLIDAAIAAGVKLFVASEFSADITSERYKLFPTEIVGDKLQIRRYLEEKAAEGKIAWTALNGGPFFDMCTSLSYAI